MSRQTYRTTVRTNKHISPLPPKYATRLFPSLSTSLDSSSPIPGTKPLYKALASVLLVALALSLIVGAPHAQGGETAEEVFRDHISEPVVQAKCVNCHVAGGLSGNTRLVFVRSSDTPDHEALNLRTFEALLDQIEDEGGGTYILNKIQGVAHGGGRQVPLGSAHFANMERFLGLLGEPVTRVRLTPETLFDTVVLASDRKTLRRAALIFAGRIPADEEYESVESGKESDLRATIRGLMTGPQFHEFLLRASNDRLLTDRQDHNVLFREPLAKLLRRPDLGVELG